ncbi:radical SAM protein [Clostridium felsineum]|uniref:radical SAM protein n=1 Tax=Clostridium felsineum TaxID=36839 RepID=UPI00098CE01C|nr:radical SAM protein [Clostridium felsineum]URZ18668.1 hypothetical protein CLFE_047560 [Clostridium felsineum DSM 794]
MLLKPIRPSNIAILGTFKCSAACQECCFECSPNLSQELSLHEIKSFINQATKINTVKFIVWSGGECFLLGKKLLDGISYAYEHNLVSRCVTNGFWASSLDEAKLILEPMAKSGLKELSLSTGDDHQQFVKIENILNATIVALNLGIIVAIAIETTKNSKFKKEDLVNHQLYKKYIKDKDIEKNLKIISTIWMSFHTDRTFKYEDILNVEKEYSGCDSLFDSIVLTPDKSIASCCGLTLEHIPEMHIGELNENNVNELYEKQFLDFIKIWIYVDGAAKILTKVKQWNTNIEYPKFVHVCQSCAYLYHNTEVMNTIKNNFQKIIEEVLEKYESKRVLRESLQELQVSR